MARQRTASANEDHPTPEQVEFLKAKMAHLALRNPSWGIAREDYRKLYFYLAIQKITYLYDDELFERLVFVDRKETGKAEELLDAYLIVDHGDEIQLQLFQFKYKDSFGGGISTKELYAFVDRMNRVFLRRRQGPGDSRHLRVRPAIVWVHIRNIWSGGHLQPLRPWTDPNPRGDSRTRLRNGRPLLSAP